MVIPLIIQFDLLITIANSLALFLKFLIIFAKVSVFSVENRNFSTDRQLIIIASIKINKFLLLFTGSSCLNMKS